MSNASIYITAFNNASADFLEDISSAYPTVAVFGLLKTLHRAASAKDETIPIDRFKTHVMEKYGARLRTQDFSFFMSENYQEAPVENDVIAHIKKLWMDMSPGNRECVKEHLKLLVQIFDKVTASL
eukprot:jgi/Tetstr1/447268/TSEL_034705.t1